MGRRKLQSDKPSTDDECDKLSEISNEPAIDLLLTDRDDYQTTSAAIERATTNRST